jgi:DNA-binding LacI/PurR family transcriptional regulator
VAIARLSDIAQRAGVSKTAVSKVLNDRPIRIGAARREQILRLARELRYRPNIIARSLNRRSTRTVGVVVYDMSTLFYPQLLRTLELSLACEGYQTLICNTEDNPVREREQVDNLLGRLVDGLVVAPACGAGNIEYFRTIHDQGTPFILIDRYFPGEPFRYLVTDNCAAARNGAAWLLRRGVRTLTYLGERGRNPAVDERLAGVRAAAQQQGVALRDEDVVFCDVSRISIRKALQARLARAPRGAGLFLESNRMLMGVLDVCRDARRSVPADLRIVGFDPFGPDLARPADFGSLHVLTEPVPTIQQDTGRLAALATAYLLASFKGESADAAAWQCRLPAKLVVSEDSSSKESTQHERSPHRHRGSKPAPV